MEDYLVDIPILAGEKGISKVLLVRHEVIEIKHIFTEIFHRKGIDIEATLEPLNISLFQYMHYMTNRLRRLHKLDRFVEDPNVIVNYDYKSFFKYLELAKRVGSTRVILDFDGVITSKKFRDLYSLIYERTNIFVCTANPEVNEDRFEKLELQRPSKIFANKGKIKKLKTLIAQSFHFDFTFYVDDETKYLDIAWLFGIKTFHYRNGKIYKHSLNSK